jgi:CheY-like chemotaxis protein
MEAFSGIVTRPERACPFFDSFVFMPAVRLVCWKEDLARERARALEEAGFPVDASPLNPSGGIGQFRANSPSVILIDLDRLPSHGREVAVALRQSKATRQIPIVFAGGQEDKVERIRRELPDAFFTDWAKVARVLKMALKSAPAKPVIPTAHMQRYRGSSLVKKLGFKPNMKAALLGAPEDFEEKLGELPEGIELQNRITRRTELAIWFVRSRKELEIATDHVTVRLPQSSSVWMIHPKQTGRYKVDFNQNDVRRAGLAAGLVDYKVCAVDDDWSGLKFTRKKS